MIKALFTRIPLDLYKKMEKMRVDENISQREFLEKIIRDYIDRKETKEFYRKNKKEGNNNDDNI